MATLPIISLAPFLDPNPNAQLLSHQLSLLSHTCQTTGFFYLTDHSIPLIRLSQILSLTRSFFLTASDAEKSSLARSSPDSARGYQTIGENVTKGKRDAHEAVDFYREWEEGEFKEAGISDGVLGGRNFWPKTPADLETELKGYVEEVKRVGSVLVKAMGMALGLEGDEQDAFTKGTSDSFWVMRMIGYPPLEEGSEGISCGEHSDYGCVTLLLTDDTKGALEVKSKDGSWIKADPIEGAFVVNIGDMMELWTNGLWKSTLHRVIHKGTNYRVSVPLFFEPNFDTRIKPLRKCIEKTGEKAMGEEVKYGDHLLGKIRGNFY